MAQGQGLHEIANGRDLLGRGRRLVEVADQADADAVLVVVALAGMRAADRRIAMHYRAVGKPENYRGEFYPGPHKFDVPMQREAFEFYKKNL